MTHPSQEFSSWLDQTSRDRSLMILVLMLGGCSDNGSSGACMKDTDCKGARICVQGVCVDPGIILDAASANDSAIADMPSDATLVGSSGDGGCLSKSDTLVYAHSDHNLYIINTKTWSETSVGSFGVAETMNDIAMAPDGTLYTVSNTSLYTVDCTTAAAKWRAYHDGSHFNALTFLPSNTLLAATREGDLKKIDPTSGFVTPIGNYGDGLGSSGDLVAIGDGTMYGVSHLAPGGGDANANNWLVIVNTTTGVAHAVGQIGFGYFYGLAYWAGHVIGFTGYMDGSGDIIEIDRKTGHGSLLSKQSNLFFGATQSPLIPPG